MPRTKATNRNKATKSASSTGAAGTAATVGGAAAKRTRDSVTEEAMANALRELERLVSARMFEITLDYEQHALQTRNLFGDIRQQLGPSLLARTLGDLKEHGLAGAAGLNATTRRCSGNSTLYGGSGGSGKRMTRDDEGYLTEESAAHTSTASTSTVSRSGRPLGPLASAKAKSRRSRSAQSNQNNTTVNTTSSSNRHGTLQRSASQQSADTLHASRSKYRTPGCSRLQTMSAERHQMMAPVTPKMQMDRPLAMLRYQKIGETVISLSGSPVIAQGVTREGANINIPVANGVISVLPSAMSSVEPNFMQQLDPETLKQLRMLQSNLNLMMSQVKD